MSGEIVVPNIFTKLAKLTNLHMLNVSYLALKNEDLMQLKRFPSLQKLIVKKLYIQEKLNVSLLIGLPCLQQIEVSEDQVRKEGDCSLA